MTSAFPQFPKLPAELRGRVIGHRLAEAAHTGGTHEGLRLRAVSREFHREVERQQPSLVADTLQKPMQVCSVDRRRNREGLFPLVPEDVTAMRTLLKRLADSRAPRTLSLPHTPPWAGPESTIENRVPEGYGTRKLPQPCTPQQMRDGFAARCDFLVEAVRQSRRARAFHILVPQLPDALTFNRIFAALDAPEQFPYGLRCDEQGPQGHSREETVPNPWLRSSFLSSLPIGPALTRLDLQDFPLCFIDEQQHFFDHVGHMRGLQELRVTLFEPFELGRVGHQAAEERAHQGLRALTGLQRLSVACWLREKDTPPSTMLFSIADVLGTLTGLTYLQLEFFNSDGNVATLAPAEANAFPAALESLEALQSLVLRENDHSASFLASLMGWLRRHPHPIDLDLSYCGLSTAALVPMMAELARAKKPLRTLLLHGPVYEDELGVAERGMETQQNAEPLSPETIDADWLAPARRWLTDDSVKQLSLCEHEARDNTHVAALALQFPDRIITPNDADQLAWSHF